MLFFLLDGDGCFGLQRWILNCVSAYLQYSEGVRMTSNELYYLKKDHPSPCKAEFGYLFAFMVLHVNVYNFDCIL